MTVYVDALENWGEIVGYHGAGSAQARRVGVRHGHMWCHMFADAADAPELHAMAKRIGMRREWFQRDHYDLVPTKRDRVVALGVVEVDRDQSVEIWKKQRVTSDRSDVVQVGDVWERVRHDGVWTDYAKRRWLKL